MRRRSEWVRQPKVSLLVEGSAHPNSYWVRLQLAAHTGWKPGNDQTKRLAWVLNGPPGPRGSCSGLLYVKKSTNVASFHHHSQHQLRAEDGFLSSRKIFFFFIPLTKILITPSGSKTNRTKTVNVVLKPTQRHFQHGFSTPALVLNSGNKTRNHGKNSIPFFSIFLNKVQFDLISFSSISCDQRASFWIITSCQSGWRFNSVYSS